MIGVRGRGPVALQSSVAAQARLRGRPEDVYAGIAPKYTRPSHTLSGKLGPFRFDPADVDTVMRRHAVGDVQALLRTAAALDDGDLRLSFTELSRAGEQVTAHVTGGYSWKQSTLADVMGRRAIKERTALLREARRIDDGDRVLSRAEFERAADVLTGIVRANDVRAVDARVHQLARSFGGCVDELGRVGGFALNAVRIPHTGKGAPKLRVVVTGGVHGSEPCGTGASLLFAERLLSSPELREQIDVTVMPLVNPRGLAAGTRHAPGDIDLNRHFVTTPIGDTPDECEVVRRLLIDTRPDLVIDLHSGYASRPGFWLYHRNGTKLGRKAMDTLATTFPVLQPGEVEKPMPAQGVIDSPPLAEDPTTEGTLKDLATRLGAKWSFTVEAPGSVSYLDQVLGEAEIALGLVDAALATRGRRLAGSSASNGYSCVPSRKAGAAARRYCDQGDDRWSETHKPTSRQF